MTTHELAQKLLAGPDEPVYVVNEDDSAPEPVAGLERLAQNEWLHHHTNQPVLEDSNGNLFPEHYTIVIA
jgi:hypothetical protein